MKFDFWVFCLVAVFAFVLEFHGWALSNKIYFNQINRQMESKKEFFIDKRTLCAKTLCSSLSHTPSIRYEEKASDEV